MHLSESEIERFLAARLQPADQQRVVRHLLAGCGVCSRKLIEQTPERLLDGPLRSRAVLAALRQEARLRTSEERLARSLELLRGTPRGYDDLSFQQIRALHGRPLVEALLRRSHELRYTDPRAMRWIAYNAVKAAESLRPEECDPPALLDLQARGWAEMANAYKVNEEYMEAEGAFARARDLLRRGSGDLHLLAHVAALEASLRSAQRRLAEARDLLDGVYRLYLKLGDRHLAGQALFSKGLSAEHDGTYRAGVALFQKGFALLDAERDPQLFAIGRQGLITALVGAGDYREAGRLLLTSELRQRLGDVPNVRWVEGRLLAGIGQVAKAENALTRVREDFLELGRSSSAALAGLDLLPLLLRQGRHGLVRQTAREIYGTLRDLGILQEAARAEPYLQ